MASLDTTMLRRALLWLLLLGAVGTLADLALTKHWKEPTQWPPLVLLVAIGSAAGWALAAGSRAAWRAVQGVSWACLPATAAGLFFHVRANVEWARDDNAALAGWPLVRDTLFGTLPTLAPGAMLYLGLIGLLAAWRVPADDAPSSFPSR
jgi:hypothetical protein